MARQQKAPSGPPSGPPKRRRRASAGAAPPTASAPAPEPSVDRSSAPGLSGDGSSALPALLPGPYIERVPNGADPMVVILPRGVEVVRLLARNGRRLPAIAATLGVCRNTLHTAMERQPEARLAYEEGRAFLEAEHLDRLLQHARSGDKICDMFLLKTQFGHREAGNQPPRDAPKFAVQIINFPAALSEADYARKLQARDERPLIEVHVEERPAEDVDPPAPPPPAHTSHDAARDYIARQRELREQSAHEQSAQGASGGRAPRRD